MIILQAQVSTKGIKTVNKYGGIDKAAKKLDVDLRLVVCNLDSLQYMKSLVVSDKSCCCTAFLDNSRYRSKQGRRWILSALYMCVECMLCCIRSNEFQCTCPSIIPSTPTPGEKENAMPRL